MYLKTYENRIIGFGDINVTSINETRTDIYYGGRKYFHVMLNTSTSDGGDNNYSSTAANKIVAYLTLESAQSILQGRCWTTNGYVNQQIQTVTVYGTNTNPTSFSDSSDITNWTKITELSRTHTQHMSTADQALFS